MECGARMMRKSIRPARRTSKPGSHILMTRWLGGRGATTVMGEHSFWDHIEGHYSPTDDDPKWIPIGGAGPPCAFL